MFRKFAVFVGFVFLLIITPADAKMRLAVLEFQNNGNEGSLATDAVCRGITDMLTTELFKTGAFEVYERSRMEGIAKEQRMSATGVLDPNTAVSLGRIAGVETVVIGAITEFSFNQSGGVIPLPIGGWGGVAVGNQKATVALDLRVIDVETGKVRMVAREKGTADKSIGGIATQYGGYFESENGGILAAAAYDCVVKVARKMQAMVPGSAHKVLSASGSSVTINVGSNDGVQPGQLMAVFFETNPIVDLDGSILGVEREYLAVLKVKEAQGAYSKCEVVKGSGGKLERGDNVEILFGSPDEIRITTHSRALAALGGASAPVEPAPSPVATVSSVPDKPSPQAKGTSSTGSSAAQVQQAVLAQEQPPKPVLKDNSVANTSVQSEVIDFYPVDNRTKNNIKIAHRGAYNIYSKRQYKKALETFERAFNLYPEGNYLHAYWAGRAAFNLRRKADARSWMERALEINSNYAPALDFIVEKKL